MQKVGLAIGIASLLLGLLGLIDSGLDWFQWWQAVSPVIPSVLLVSGISIIIVFAVGPLWHRLSPLFRPGLRLKKLSHLLEEGKALDDDLERAVTAGDNSDFNILLDFKSHTKLISLEIRRLFNIDLNPDLQYWTVIIRELAPLAKNGEYEAIHCRCYELVSIQWNKESI